VGIVVSVALFVTITMALWSTSWPVTEAPQPVDNIRTLGRMLMTRFVLPFEIASVLLLAAMIGAIVIAAKESGSREDQEGQEGA
jgi:NADH:ubiquinone oxidoreductase subunit 6 (subunit J)